MDNSASISDEIPRIVREQLRTIVQRAITEIGVDETMDIVNTAINAHMDKETPEDV